MNLTARTATIASSVVLAALTGLVAPQVASAAPAAAPTATSVAAATRVDLTRYYPVHETLRPGSTSPWVWELQYDLSSLGYKVKATAVYDAQTKAAVVAFQRKAHLKADGIVGKGTWQALGKQMFPVLSLGARGAAVTRLQNQLRDWSFLTGRSDGVYGKATVAAVKKAQRDMHLPVTGVADVRLNLALASGMGC